MPRKSNYSRPWVRLSVDVLDQDDLVDVSCPARSMFFFSLARAAREQRDGLIATSPRLLMRWCPFLKDEAEAISCREELIEAEFWIKQDDDNCSLRSWGTYQDSLDRQKERREGNAARQARYRERNKPDSAQQDTVSELDVRVSEDTDTGTGATGGGTSKTDLRDAIVEACRAGEQSYEFFQAMLVTAADLAADASTTEGLSDSTDFLKQAVLAEAIAAFWDDRIPSSHLPQYYKAAKIHGYEPVLWAVQECCTVTGLEQGRESRYVLKAAGSKAAELKGAK